MRIGLVLVAATACGPSTKPVEYPPLPGDVATAPVPASPAEAGAPEADLDRTFPEAGPPCMPAGDYDIEVDLGAASITNTTEGDSSGVLCKSWLLGVATQSKNQMKIEFPDGRLTVHWPEYTIVRPRGECAFEVMTQPMRTTLTFADGKGTGTTSYAVGSPNHPDETCAADGVGLVVVHR